MWLFIIGLWFLILGPAEAVYLIAEKIAGLF